jgi:putative GTP pyrophosphokinase
MENEQKQPFGRTEQIIKKYYTENVEALGRLTRLLDKKLNILIWDFAKDEKKKSEAFRIGARTKTLESILNKLEYKKWPSFEQPMEAINDIIGARISCWYLEDCIALKEFIEGRKEFRIFNAENYIFDPKRSGYRAIHISLFVELNESELEEYQLQDLVGDKICEIQLRTRLQDLWGELTHEYYYQAKITGLRNTDYEEFYASCSERFFNEDKLISEFQKKT